jgi:hypothetical protein
MVVARVTWRAGSKLLCDGMVNSPRRRQPQKALLVIAQITAWEGVKMSRLVKRAWRWSVVAGEHCLFRKAVPSLLAVILAI